MQIKDIMVSEVIAVAGDMPIVEVANLLVRHGIHGVPVVDEEGKVLGIITETDFFLKNSIALHLPTYVDMVEHEIEKKADMLDNIPDMKALLEATARDIMTKNCVALPEVADVRDLFALVKMHHYKTFPVTDYRGILVGIVTLIDAIASLDRSVEM